MQDRQFTLNLAALLALGSAASLGQAFAQESAAERGMAQPASFMIGADISWIQQQEVEGTQWSDEQTQEDLFVILKEHGFNWMRLRLFVDPTAEGGYSKQGFCNLEHTLQMARRIKAAGLSTLLDFHLSDTWADPAHQWKPSAWAELRGNDLEQAVKNHTCETMLALKRQDTLPDMVQIGNEISNGMLWPDGKVWETNDWDSFCRLIKAGIAGVQAADPSIKIMLHLAWGGQNAQSRAFLDRLLEQGVEFDVIGQSYYPQWHGTLEQLDANLTDLAQRYSQSIILVEYSIPNVRRINDIVRGLPDHKGLGTFIWEPTKWQGGALFDNSGRTRPAIDIYRKMATDYGLLAQ